MTQSTLPDASLADSGSVISISTLNRLAREKLESAFPLCWVAGEISNLTYAASGHVYFSLKDPSAQVRCVMFRSRAQLLGWRLANGQHIEARVRVTLYEARGDFQLSVEAARQAGVGNLYEQFLRLKEKLAREGLFDPERKRPLPVFPRRIGVVTSLQAAALRDVLTTLGRRAPHVGIVLYPVPVQGEGAAQQIADMLIRAGQRGECELLILCRGGGSLEDLWAFNDENLARAIRACALPVIVGVGHETDLSIADFAADRRAPTPTAAAELAAPELRGLQVRIDELRDALQRRCERQLERRAQQLDWLARRLLHPGQRLEQQRNQLAQLARRLAAAFGQQLAERRHALTQRAAQLRLARPAPERQRPRLELMAQRLHGSWQRQGERRADRLARAAASLSHLNPEGVLARGYSIVHNAAGEVVRDAAQLEPNDPITVFLHTGSAKAQVSSVDRAPPPNDK